MFTKEIYTVESIITERYTPSINHRQFLGQFSKNQYYSILKKSIVSKILNKGNLHK